MHPCVHQCWHAKSLLTWYLVIMWGFHQNYNFSAIGDIDELIKSLRSNGDRSAMSCLCFEPEQPVWNVKHSCKCRWLAYVLHIFDTVRPMQLWKPSVSLASPVNGPWKFVESSITQPCIAQRCQNLIGIRGLWTLKQGRIIMGHWGHVPHNLDWPQRCQKEKFVCSVCIFYFLFLDS